MHCSSYGKQQCIIVSTKIKTKLATNIDYEIRILDEKSKSLIFYLIFKYLMVIFLNDMIYITSSGYYACYYDLLLRLTDLPSYMKKTTIICLDIDKVSTMYAT